MKNLLLIILFGLILCSCSKDEKPGCTMIQAHNYDNQATLDDGSCQTCFDGIQNGEETGIDCGGTCEPCFGVGLHGEAGGIIFYDKGSYTNGWRYLEVAPSDINNRACFSEQQFSEQFNTDNNIGTGLENTVSLASISNDASIYKLALNFTENGKSDWFIPSKDELFEIYNNRDLIPGLSTSSGECTAYWCSTLEELNNGNWLPEVLAMASGEFFFTNPSQPVRLIRRF